MFVINNQHEATITKTVCRLVFCEECDAQYVYQMFRSASGYGNSLYFLDESGAKSRAESSAKSKLKKKMKGACEAIPCPKCAHYQDHMIPKAKSDKALLAWVGACVLGLLPAFIGFILVITGNESIGTTLISTGLVVALIIGALGAGIYMVYDPNKDSEEKRFDKAEATAMTRKAFEREFHKQTEEQFDIASEAIRRGKRYKDIEGTIWADREQIQQSIKLKLVLPTGDEVKVPLRPKLKNGEKYQFEVDVQSKPLTFVYVLQIYTEAV
ncbi:MAG: hypothetical protein ACRC8S_15195 [Fimbriiglobus sp.]